MILAIATVVVLVLIAIALLPVRKRDGDGNQPTRTVDLLPSARSSSVNLREQQLQEEASAIAQEYRRKADEVWLEEVRAKAAALLAPPENAVSE